MRGIAEWLSGLQHHRVIGVVRAGEPELAYHMGACLAQAGLRFIEVTWDCPEVQTVIPRLQIAYPDCWVGTGTIRREAELEEALSLGVDFIFTPHTQREWLSRSHMAGIPLVPGALTPTEILQAYHWGAPAVKVFPIASVGGADYLRHLREPLGAIPLIPTGGVTRANAHVFFQAGAIAVGIGRDLFPQPWYSQRDWAGLVQELQQWLNGLGLTAGATMDSP
ncbi:MAG: bifunctional 4-hydroxy-2-oxoglutarate aldolase/2-dehydro-3-deoxy-phosphogluconate aldolase [Gloeomargarita sp. SKYG116]|nr:bifunctional 4-hydroxy-2-oxoglutarate aldolase/2-dehydro-3-deoxy-phosphogluconate aldolase [Gloeomargarita sp. SKYG116]MCS7225991.1 bifunctional 4-hydroxy-2-oxoglutarate aldolase/2-dehydro-3-deoxy-phosphogluconate aldolase [Gloeomargarita sp. SKYB31]MDW8401843.1 bifunctional 4-hydroxy-2-oxoglutarate aldolase/2-dehydro-3-deoxy-phosphogluconate aldolase [Gloeomargarita sp. SKYGB_i_bin116]